MKCGDGTVNRFQEGKHDFNRRRTGGATMYSKVKHFAWIYVKGVELAQSTVVVPGQNYNDCEHTLALRAKQSLSYQLTDSCKGSLDFPRPLLLGVALSGGGNPETHGGVQTRLC